MKKIYIALISLALILGISTAFSQIDNKEPVKEYCSVHVAYGAINKVYIIYPSGVTREIEIKTGPKAFLEEAKKLNALFNDLAKEGYTLKNSVDAVSQGHYIFEK